MGRPVNIKQFVSVLPDGRKQLATSYEFENVGDEIEMHQHTFWHNCQVIRGSVKIYDPSGRSIVVEAGGLAGLAADKPHAIQAAEAGTVIMNTNDIGHP